MMILLFRNVEKLDEINNSRDPFERYSLHQLDRNQDINPSIPARHLLVENLKPHQKASQSH